MATLGKSQCGIQVSVRVTLKIILLTANHYQVGHIWAKYALSQCPLTVPSHSALSQCPLTVLSIRFEVGGYLGTAPARVIWEAQENFTLENFQKLNIPTDFQQDTRQSSGERQVLLKALPLVSSFCAFLPAVFQAKETAYRLSSLLMYINNSLHMARKYARIFVRGHYLF